MDVANSHQDIIILCRDSKNQPGKSILINNINQVQNLRDTMASRKVENNILVLIFKNVNIQQ